MRDQLRGEISQFSELRVERRRRCRNRRVPIYSLNMIRGDMGNPDGLTDIAVRNIRVDVPALFLKCARCEPLERGRAARAEAVGLRGATSGWTGISGATLRGRADSTLAC